MTTLRPLGRSIASVLWALLLAPTVLLVAYLPGWGVLLSSRWWLAAIFVSVLLLFAFAAWGKERRRTIVALLLASWVLDLVGLTDITFGRLVVWAGVTVLAIISLEVLRQNIGLVRDLRQRDPAFKEKVQRAVVYWSPMLLFAWAGWLVHGLIVDEAQQLVYDQTPIDQYCKAEPEPVPCEGLAVTQELPAKPLTLEATLAHYWHERFRAQQQGLLLAIMSSDPVEGISDAVFMNKEALTAYIAGLDAKLRPQAVLLIPRNDGLQEEELLNSDPVTQRLRQDRAALERQAQGSVSIGTGIGAKIHIPRSLLMKPRIDQLDAQLRKRREELLAKYSQQLIAPTQVPGSVHYQLTRRLPPAPPLRVEPGLLVQKPEQVPGARATLAALVVTRLADLEQSTLQTAESIVRGASDLHGRDPGAAIDPRQQLEKIGFPALCSNEIDSPNSTEDDAGKVPVRVNTRPFPCNVRLSIVDGARQPLDLLDSVYESIEHWRQRQEQNLENTSRAALVQTIRQGNQAQSSAMALSAMVPASIELGRKRCRLLEGHTWGNCATNWAKAKAEGTYASARADAGRAYARAVDDMRRAGQSNAAQLILYEREQARLQLQEAEADLRAAVRSVRSGLDLLGTLLLFFLILALIKSVLYTLALKLYAAGGPSFVQVDGSSAIVSGSPRVAPVNSQTGSLEFPDVTAENPLVTREYLVHQVKRNARMPPWPFSGVLSRLLYRRYFFFNIGGPEPESTVAWFSSTGRFIADWMLQPGEAVVFHYRNFVGASQQVNLRSLVSFRLDTMLFGRFTFAVAVATEQPGHLLLEARSLSAEAVTNDNIHTAMPERLVAWHANTAFQVASAQTLGSVYLDPFALARVKDMQPRGRMLVDTTPVRSFFYGSFRYALRVLSPL
jgi:hypothetical protein